MYPGPPSRRIALVIWFALCAGVTMFAVVASLVGPTVRERGGGAPEVLAWVALGVAIVALAASRLVPGLVRAPPGAPPEAAGVTRTIIAAALNEGAGLLAVVVWMVTGQLAVVALAISAVGLLLAFPSEERWKRLCAGPGGTATSRLVR